jgi:hypothetical protein
MSLDAEVERALAEHDNHEEIERMRAEGWQIAWTVDDSVVTVHLLSPEGEEPDTRLVAWFAAPGSPARN